MESWSNRLLPSTLIYILYRDISLPSIFQSPWKDQNIFCHKPKHSSYINPSLLEIHRIIREPKPHMFYILPCHHPPESQSRLLYITMEWFCSKGITLDYATQSSIARSGDDGGQRGAWTTPLS
jgi:hypothetical protein